MFKIFHIYDTKNKNRPVKTLLQASQTEDTLHCIVRLYKVNELKCLLDIMLEGESLTFLRI